MTIKVSEIFGPTIQGEGDLIGAPTVFVRFGGCDYRCVWCDTLYAVLPEYKATWRTMTPQEIRDEVKAHSTGSTIVTFSGGNPALYDLTGLVGLLADDGHAVAVETQGSVFKPWLADVAFLTVSPKPPSSGMETNEAVLRQVLECHPHSILKIVVGSHEDYEWAKGLISRMPKRRVYLQPCNPYGASPAAASEAPEASLAMYRQVAEWVLRDQWEFVRVLPQLHLLAWGQRRGI